MPTETKASRILSKLAAPAMAAAASYAFEKQAEKKKEPGVFKSLLPGAAAGVVSTAVTAPLDRVKDTMTQFGNQAALARKAGNIAEAEHLEGIAKNVVTSAKSIFKSQGPKGFYKGMTGSLIKMPIAMGTTFAVADYLKRKLSKKNGR